MNDVSDLPTIIPTVAGAGIMNTTTYSVVGEEPEEDTNVSYDNKSYATIFTDDFSDSSRSITKTSGIPSNSGIFYQITGDVDANDYNYLNISGNKVNIYDYSSNTAKDGDDGNGRTTYAYYMFDSNNQFDSSTIKYSIELNIPVNSSWAMLGFVDEKNSISLSIYSNSSKYLGYRYNSSETDMFESQYSSGIHKISLIVDYDDDEVEVVIDGVSSIVEDYKPSTIRGLYFQTSGSAARSFSFSNISIAKENDTKLGYQFGSYTYNDTEYKALRIVGKFDYSDLITNVDNISSIEVNIDLVNNNSVVYKSVTQKITDIYSSLKLSDGTTIAPADGNVRYYYVVIKGITSSHNGYKINATTTITLKNGTVINCSGFSYTINI